MPSEFSGKAILLTRAWPGLRSTVSSGIRLSNPRVRAGVCKSQRAPHVLAEAGVHGLAGPAQTPGWRCPHGHVVGSRQSGLAVPVFGALSLTSPATQLC